MKHLILLALCGTLAHAMERIPSESEKTPLLPMLNIQEEPIRYTGSKKITYLSLLSHDLRNHLATYFLPTAAGTLALLDEKNDISEHDAKILFARCLRENYEVPFASLEGLQNKTIKSKLSKARTEHQQEINAVVKAMKDNNLPLVQAYLTKAIGNIDDVTLEQLLVAHKATRIPLKKEAAYYAALIETFKKKLTWEERFSPTMKASMAGLGLASIAYVGTLIWSATTANTINNILSNSEFDIDGCDNSVYQNCSSNSIPFNCNATNGHSFCCVDAAFNVCDVLSQNYYNSLPSAAWTVPYIAISATGIVLHLPFHVSLIFKQCKNPPNSHPTIRTLLTQYQRKVAALQKDIENNEEV